MATVEVVRAEESLDQRLALIKRDVSQLTRAQDSAVVKTRPEDEQRQLQQLVFLKLLRRCWDAAWTTIAAAALAETPDFQQARSLLVGIRNDIFSEDGLPPGSCIPLMKAISQLENALARYARKNRPLTQSQQRSVRKLAERIKRRLEDTEERVCCPGWLPRAWIRLRRGTTLGLIRFEPGEEEVIQRLLCATKRRFNERVGKTLNFDDGIVRILNDWSLTLFATGDDIERRYDQRMMQMHPDRGGTNEQAARLNEDVRILRDWYRGQ